MPRPNNPHPRANGKLAALLGFPAAAAMLAGIAQWEGKENVAYQDIAQIWTICYGDTTEVRPGQRATDAECDERLERQAIRHLDPILACVPQLRDPARRNQAVASGILAYNIGVRGFCNSTAAREFRALNWRAGCDAFLRFNKARVNGRLVPVRGLTNRRNYERNICIRGL